MRNRKQDLEKQDQAVILALEASTDACSAAIRLPSGQTYQAIHSARYGHSEHLIGLMQQVMAEAGCAFDDITHIAAGCGPGSFTGIRICLAAATGLLLAGRAAPVGVCLLSAMHHKYSGVEHSGSPILGVPVLGVPVLGVPVLAVIDSRRQSAYGMLAENEAPISDLSEADLQALLDKTPDMTLLGTLPDGWKDGLLKRYQFCQPDADMVAALAAFQLAEGHPILPLRPLYLAAPKLGPQKPKPSSLVGRKDS